MSKFAAGIIAISLVVLTAADYAGAQSWRRFTTANGLAGNTVWAILEDRNGTLWFGTENGLSNLEESFITHLSGMEIFSLLESEDGTIWAGTIDDGLHSYDGSRWQEHLSEMSVISLLESEDGTIWVGTYENGLHSYDGSVWQEHLRGMWVYSLLESQNGTIWAGTQWGLHSYDGIEWQKHLSGTWIIESLLESQNGTIWAGTEWDGLHSYDGSRWQEHLSGMDIRCLLESRDGTIWAGANGLHSYDGSRWQEHLSGMDIRWLLESRDDTIWVGTFLDGLHSYDGSRWQQHLSGIRVYSLLESQDDTIWAGTSWGLYCGIYIEGEESSRSYTIIATAGEHGAISPAGEVIVESGANATFRIEPDPCYRIASLLVDNEPEEPVTEEYIFENVTSHHTIQATFLMTDYIITATTSPNGTVTPSGDVQLKCGSDQEFIMTPATGYHLSELLVDGTAVKPESPYTFTNVTSKHTIEARFAINIYTITAIAGENGSISPPGTQAKHGESATFTITPDPCYRTFVVLINNEPVFPVPEEYTFSNVTSNRTIEAIFVMTDYIITATTGPNGSVTPSGEVPVKCGSDQEFTMTPATGCRLSELLVDGTEVKPESPYTFTNVTSNHTIEARFAIKTYDITATAGENGSISPPGSTQVSHGGNVTFTITPNPCYQIANLLVDNEPVGPVPEEYTFPNVTSDHTIEATFAIKTLIIRSTYEGSGTISPSGGVRVQCGSDQTFAIAPATGYRIADVLVDSSSVGKEPTYTFPNVTSDHTIQARFEVVEYTIRATAGANGSISPSGDVEVNHGESVKFTIAPASCHHIEDVLLDGISVGAVTEYTFENIISDHTIEARFEADTYVIEATAGANGSISPSGGMEVKCGANQTFAITPATGYYVSDVLVDGESVSAVTEYTFGNVTSNHTIEARFEINFYTIEVIAGEHGSISPLADVEVNHGGSVKFTIAPASCHHIEDVLVDSISVGAVATYTFNNVTSDHRIEALFAINTYTIKSSAEANGSILPSGDINVICGSDQTFNMIPDRGYHMSDVLVDGRSVGATTTYRFTNVTSDHTIRARFGLTQYTITASTGANGIITPSGEVGVSHGDSVAFTIKPDEGYHVLDVTVDGDSVGAITSYTFSRITSAHMIGATFEINTYTVTATAGEGGSISPSGELLMKHSGGLVFTIKPDEGYHVKDVEVDGRSEGPVTSYTLTNITSAHMIGASFEINTYTITGTAGANGSITPSGDVQVKHGGSQTFIIEPDPGYYIMFVMVDSRPEGAITSYTFTNITSDHRIEASLFEDLTVEITEPQEQAVKIGIPSLFIAWTEKSLLTYEFRIDEGEWEPISGNSMTTPIMKDGDHTFDLRAIDRSGNFSKDSLTIIVDTGQPNVLISSPVQNEVVGGMVSIEGGADDTDLLEFSVEYAEGENPSDSAYKLIERASARRSGELAKLDTAELEEGGYTIRVRATDELEHTRDYAVYIMVDNTRPLVELSNPVPNQKLAGKTAVEGNVEDLNIAAYTLQIIQGNNVKWFETMEIFASQKIERRDIDTSAIYGSAAIHLTAIDEAGNKSEPADVEVFFNNEGARPTARLESPRENDVIKGNFEIEGEARSVGIFRSYAVRYAPGHNPSEDDWDDIGEGLQPSTERLATWNTMTLPDGKYSIRLTTTDENDYSSEHMVHVVIDNTEPVIGLESPEDGGIEAGEVSIRGSVTDSNFGSYRIQFAPGANPGTGWEQMVEVPESVEIDTTWRTDGLDGLYSIRVIAVDKAIPDPNEATVVHTITLDNTFAEAIITSPQEMDFISDTVQIMGTANDDNFSHYEVFWGEGNNPSEWNPIATQRTTPVINDTLTSWDTAGLESYRTKVVVVYAVQGYDHPPWWMLPGVPGHLSSDDPSLSDEISSLHTPIISSNTARDEAIYTIRLAVYDKSGHEAPYSVLVTVDNTPPTAEITSPRDGEQIGGVVEIEGTAWDANNFKEYVVELEERALPLPLVKSATSVERGKLLNWIPDNPGTFIIRLAVTDRVDHKSEASVTVEVMPEVSRDSGADASSSDEIATLSIPPRSLLDDTSITINRVPPEYIEDIALSVPDRAHLLDSVYYIGPEGLRLRSIKPATLQMKLPDSDRRTAFFRWDQEKLNWTFLGGTLQEGKLTIGITEFGYYALMEMEGVPEPLSDDVLFTCQPRVFSPERGDKATITFGADEDTSVTLEVYNVDGWLERELVSGETMRVGRNAVVWDGTDDDGQTLPSGIYLIALTVGDSKVRTKAVVILNQGVR